MRRAFESACHELLEEGWPDVPPFRFRPARAKQCGQPRFGCGLELGGQELSEEVVVLFFFKDKSGSENNVVARRPRHGAII